mgnify:CR=1 FL=1
MQKKKDKVTGKTYTHDEAFSAALDYFKGDELAARVWVNKYALKDSDGNIYELTPDDMHWRMAREIARIEERYPNPMKVEEIYELFRNFTYIIPQGGPMSGIGNNYQIASLSNCFVIGNDSNSDSYGGILKVDQEQVQLMKRRGGVGHDLSHIRPKGSPVKNSALTSTGLVPFMERYSNSTREVAQDGRRGALMLSVSIKHPDSESFIDAKMESGKMDIRLADFSIEQVIHAQCDMARPLSERKNIDLEIRVEAELPPLHQDQARVQQILNNLLSNAIKFTPEGGRIVVTAERSERLDLILRVADTGVGIAEEDQQVIFEKFRQGSTALPGGDAMTREYSGTGLGLSIVKELCKLLEGEVFVESELGTGSTFTVRLPWRLKKQPRLDSPLTSGFDEFSKPWLDRRRAEAAAAGPG